MNRQHRSERWTIVDGTGPVVITAIHAGHGVRDGVEPLLAVDAATRLREEDPFTERWLVDDPRFSSVEVHHSRFELDINRPRDRAVYITPSDAWGIHVWHQPPPPAVIEQSLAHYDDFYSRFGELLDGVVQRHGGAVVLDLHSYNHRRNGPTAPPAPTGENPDFNIGTGTLPDRARWQWAVTLGIEILAEQAVCGIDPYVAENVRFRGGHLADWVHGRYGSAACVLSIEVKKFFMDEWSGTGDDRCMAAVGERITALARAILRGFKRAR